MNFYIIISGIIIGFLIAKFFSGKKEGKQGILKSIKFSINKFNIHLHHWLIGSIILIALLIFKFYNDLVYGLIMGIIIQGLTYKDFNKIIYRKKSDQ